MSAPSWALSSATVWDDFEPPGEALLDSQLALSGASWTLLGTTLETQLFRGEAGGGRTGLAGCATAATAGANGSAWLPAPGLSPTSAYIRSDVWLDDLNTTFSLTLAGNYVSGALAGVPYYSLTVTGGATGDQPIVGIIAQRPDSSFVTLVEANLGSGMWGAWHNMELSVDSGTLTILVDGVVAATVTDSMAWTPTTATLVLTTGTGAERAYADNFEAGPLVDVPVVPTLTGAARSDMLHFEFRR